MNIYEYIRLDENEKPLDNIVTDGGYCGIFRTIACVGDSLSSGEFESKNEDGSTGYHDMYEYSWGQFMARDIGSKVYNFSRGGMTAKEYVETFADIKGFWADDKICQAYIIALGVNDIFNAKREIGNVQDINFDDYTKNADTYAGWYARIIQRYQKMQPKGKFFLVAPPKCNGGTAIEQKGVRDLLDEMTTVFKNTYLIDLYTYSPPHVGEFAETFWLGHMTPAGYRLMAKMIESYLDYIIRHNPKDFAEVGFIGTNLSYKKE